MYWKIVSVEPVPGAAPAEESAPRFVLHRHTDARGPHLDLRVEDGHGRLRGWRIAADDLAPGADAEAKRPHPAAWLDEDGAALRLDDGRCVAESVAEDRVTVLLCGRAETRRVALRAETPLPAGCARALAEAAREHRLAPETLAGLVRDGVEARDRAVARLCALGRELDGPSFDARAWRDLMAPLGLPEIRAHLAGFEARLDRLHPPEPVSRPEPLARDAEHPAEIRARSAFQLLQHPRP